MKMLFLCLGLSLGLAGVSSAAVEARQLGKVNVLPLALDDGFQFRKVNLFLNDPEIAPDSSNNMIGFQRKRVEFGAVTNFERKRRRGHYFTFSWRAKADVPVTVRLEYRQANLGAFLLAKEVDYASANGSHTTKFEVIGDEYLEDGKVTMWRAILIEGGKIVGMTQSYLWY